MTFLKVDIIYLKEDFSYVMVSNHTVGTIARYVDGFKFGMESYVENVFCPEHVAEIRRIANEYAAVCNVTKRLTG